jgi:hypothetical protein
MHVLEIPRVSLFHMHKRLQDHGQDLVSNMDRLKSLRICAMLLTSNVCSGGVQDRLTALLRHRYNSPIRALQSSTVGIGHVRLSVEGMDGNRS